MYVHLHVHLYLYCLQHTCTVYIYLCSAPFRSVFRSINFVSISFPFLLVTRFAWQTIYALCAFTVKKNKVMIYLKLTKYRCQTEGEQQGWGKSAIPKTSKTDIEFWRELSCKRISFNIQKRLQRYGNFGNVGSISCRFLNEYRAAISMKSCVMLLIFIRWYPVQEFISNTFFFIQ